MQEKRKKKKAYARYKENPRPPKKNTHAMTIWSKHEKITAANICKNCLDSLPAISECWKTPELCPCVTGSSPPTAVTSEPCDLQADKHQQSVLSCLLSARLTLQHRCATEPAWSWTRTRRPSSKRASNWDASPVRGGARFWPRRPSTGTSRLQTRQSSPMWVRRSWCSVII